MKTVLVVMTCLMLVCCKQAESQAPPTENAAVEEVAVAQPEKMAATAAFDAAIDSLPREVKEDKMRRASVSEDAWRDTACGECGQRCCVSCTANGNPAQCAETRFKNCSRCNHLSANHYSAAQ